MRFVEDFAVYAVYPPVFLWYRITWKLMRFWWRCAGQIERFGDGHPAVGLIDPNDVRNVGSFSGKLRTQGRNFEIGPTRRCLCFHLFFLRFFEQLAIFTGVKPQIWIAWGHWYVCDIREKESIDKTELCTIFILQTTNLSIFYRPSCWELPNATPGFALFPPGLTPGFAESHRFCRDQRHGGSSKGGLHHRGAWNITNQLDGMNRWITGRFALQDFSRLIFDKFKNVQEPGPLEEGQRNFR